MADSMSANDNIDWDSLDWGPFHWESTNWAEHRQPPTDPVMNPPARAPKAGSSSDSKKAATEADKDKDVGSGSRVDDLAEFVSFWDGCRARYLDEAPPHKAELDVRLGTPDIETGKPGDGGSRQFISPLSPAKVESLLKQAGTFDVPDSYDDINVGCYSGPERNKSPFNPDYHPQIEGWERGEFVRDVLTHGINGGILPRFSNWRLTR